MTIGSDSGPTLTVREVEVLSLLGRGLTAGALARELGISPRTVRKHLENVYRKLGCSDRLLAVDHGRRAGLLPPVVPDGRATSRQAHDDRSYRFSEPV